MRISRLPFAALWLALSSTTCGSSGGGACPSVNACGGNVNTGTYQIKSGCLHGAPTQVSGLCTGITGAVASAEVSGSFTFSTGNRYTTSETIQANGTMSVPTSCMTQSGVQLTCVQFAQLAQQTAGTLIVSISCSGSTSCTCPVTFKSTYSESGSYTIQGTNLGLTPDGQSTATQGAFCVAGNQITLEVSRSASGVSAHGSLVLAM
jgi:hypothetical protein